jgi:hypothetical protein
MLIEGVACLIEPHLVEMAMDAGTERYYADSMITASGADVGVLPIRSPEYCLTSRDIYAVNPHLVHLPGRMAIRGAGYTDGFVPEADFQCNEDDGAFLSVRCTSYDVRPVHLTAISTTFRSSYSRNLRSRFHCLPDSISSQG